LLGRLVDRVGQTRVLVGCAVASALSFGALAAAGGFASPVALAGLAALAGASIPPVGACMRALWSGLLGQGGQLQAAFAVESTVQELIFVIGPPLVAVLAAVLSPALWLYALHLLVLRPQARRLAENLHRGRPQRFLPAQARFCPGVRGRLPPTSRTPEGCKLVGRSKGPQRGLRVAVWRGRSRGRAISPHCRRGRVGRRHLRRRGGAKAPT
jgi:MFS family permease